MFVIQHEKVWYECNLCPVDAKTLYFTRTCSPYLYPHHPEDIQRQIKSQLESITNGWIWKCCFFLELTKHAPFKCFSEVAQVVTALPWLRYPEHPPLLVWIRMIRTPTSWECDLDSNKGESKSKCELFVVNQLRLELWLELGQIRMCKLKTISQPFTKDLNLVVGFQV